MVNKTRYTSGTLLAIIRDFGFIYFPEDVFIVKYEVEILFAHNS